MPGPIHKKTSKVEQDKLNARIAEEQQLRQKEIEEQLAQQQQEQQEYERRKKEEEELAKLIADRQDIQTTLKQYFPSVSYNNTILSTYNVIPPYSSSLSLIDLGSLINSCYESIIEETKSVDHYGRIQRNNHRNNNNDNGGYGHNRQHHRIDGQHNNKITHTYHDHSTIDSIRISSSSNNLRKEMIKAGPTPFAINQHQQILARMKHKQTFLRNPRTGIVKGTDRALTLLALPYQVLFNNYELNHHYRHIITITNIATISQNIHIRPITHRDFTIIAKDNGNSDISDSNSNDISPSAILSPGMSIHYIIIFRPSSLRDERIELMVQSQLCELLIPIIAELSQPILSLPPLLRLPSTAIDTSKMWTIRCYNSGTEGRFHFIDPKIIHDNRDPYCIDPSYRRHIWSLPDDSITIGSFTISPACFDLPRNTDIIISITFHPQRSDLIKATHITNDAIYTFVNHITLISSTDRIYHYQCVGDACQIQLEFTFKKEDGSIINNNQIDPNGIDIHNTIGTRSRFRLPHLFSIESLSLSSSNNTTHITDTNTVTDVNSNNVVQPNHSINISHTERDSQISRLEFDSTVINSSRSYYLNVNNLSRMNIPFQWYQPDNDKYSSDLPIFHIFPSSGNLQAGEIRRFTITFTPNQEHVTYKQIVQLIANQLTLTNTTSALYHQISHIHDINDNPHDKDERTISGIQLDISVLELLLCGEGTKNAQEDENSHRETEN